ncbi:MAG: alpha-1,2-fucosyltransferase, partial [Rickettsiales bacterium]|nr:alpha-1,2-fucosyltransferase [Rickettsiales bacterium]
THPPPPPPPPPPRGGGRPITLTTPLTKANEKKLKQIKETPNSVCIHIRMGDVLAPNSMYPLAKLSYIKRSIANIKKQLRGPVTFFVFSDSKLAKKIGKEYDYVNINNYDKGYFDLDLMKNCQHFICSTGSFSGLAAEMGEYNKKLVFKPYKNDVCVNQAEKEKEWEYKWIGDQTDCENLNDKSNIKIL